jgi:predicted AAA+ superfamily ATPase
MDPRFSPHNTHLEAPQHFAERDPQLRQLKKQKYIYRSHLLDQFPFSIPGIYTLGGGRQIGKSTLLKQWMLELLSKKVAPKTMVFFTGELINDHHALLHLLQTALEAMSDHNIHYIIIDEITYIKDWDKTVKYLADAGFLENTILMLTGSDLTLIQEARMRFPGRRGKAEIVNFHLYPLSFREVVYLKNKLPDINPKINIDKLFKEFDDYLKHGGFLTAINDLALNGTILKSTLTTYSDWVRGDMIKHGKQEHFCREILMAIIKRYNSQITWNSLVKDLSIDHPKTVSDYAALLESMDALFIQSVLLEDKLVGAPKKGKKVVFTDPFIFHAMRAWLFPIENPYENQIVTGLNNPELCSQLVEACVATHYRRYYPTYFIKAEGEVDVVYVDRDRFWPIEVKWTNQLRPKDTKQILKYPNGRIFSKSKESGCLQTTPVEPLPLGLFNLQGRKPSPK